MAKYSNGKCVAKYSNSLPVWNGVRSLCEQVQLTLQDGKMF